MVRTKVMTVTDEVICTGEVNQKNEQDEVDGTKKRVLIPQVMW